jgi:hypothetical protein
LKSALQKARDTTHMASIVKRTDRPVVKRPAIYNDGLRRINERERVVIHSAVKNKFIYDTSVNPLKKLTKKIDDIRKSIEQ